MLSSSFRCPLPTKYKYSDSVPTVLVSMLIQCFLPSISHHASLDLVCLLLCISLMPLLYHWYICTCKQLVWGRGFEHHSVKSSRKLSSQPGQTCYLAQHHHCTEEVSCYFALQKDVLLLKKEHSANSPCIHIRFTLKANS